MKLVVATSFGVHPPKGGGQSRVAGLYGALAKLGVEIEIVSLVDRSQRGGRLAIGPGLAEVQVPRTREHESADWRLYQEIGVPVGDLGLALHPELTPAYGEALAHASRDATAVVACHPYAFSGLHGRPLIYEAQDVEADLKASMYDATPQGREYAERVRELEGACCAAADHVLVCALRDGERLDELYGLQRERVVEVPNGADPDATPFTPLAVRRQRRRALGLGDEFQALFVGSWHEPNLAVVRELLDRVADLAGVRVTICGSAGLAFANEQIPGNFDLCGVVDDGFLRGVLGVADAALNPMRWGSGTNLKMFDYALAGVPLVCSAFGNRGVGFVPGRDFLQAEPDEVPAALHTLRAEAEETIDARTRAARAHVEERFAWRTIAAAWRAHPAFQSLLALAEVRS